MNNYYQTRNLTEALIDKHESNPTGVQFCRDARLMLAYLNAMLAKRVEEPACPLCGAERGAGCPRRAPKGCYYLGAKK